MIADIAGADRAEQRVGERVEGDVGVAMAGEAAVVRDADAAEPELLAAAKAWTSKPMPVRGDQPAASRPRRGAKSAS